MTNRHRDQLARQRRALRRLANRRAHVQLAAPKAKVPPELCSPAPSPRVDRERRTA